MISYDHSEAPISARGERGRGNGRKTAIGFRRRLVRVAHRSGNSSGRGDTATYSILQANTCRSVSDENVRDGRPQVVANAHRIAGSTNWDSFIGTDSSEYKTWYDLSEVVANPEDMTRLNVLTNNLFAEGWCKNRLIQFRSRHVAEVIKQLKVMVWVTTQVIC